MSATAKPDDTIPPPPKARGLYEADAHAWAQRQGRLLRDAAAAKAEGHPAAARRLLDALDHDNIAEELDGLAKSQEASLRSYLGTILEHLLKLEFSPAHDPRNGWRSTVRRAREDAVELMRLNPSLGPKVQEFLADAALKVVQVVPEDLADRGEGDARELRTRMRAAVTRYLREGALTREWWPPNPREQA